jgi:hypothetical protein
MDSYFEAGDAAFIIQLIFEFDDEQPSYSRECEGIRGVGTEFLDRSFLSISDV